jgi:hypothetical protein
MFCCCDKIPEKNISKEERYILLHTCRSFSPWPADTLLLSTSHQKHHGERLWWRKAAHLRAVRNQIERSVCGADIPFKDTSTVSYFLQIGLIHLLIVI